jgi:Flp pilus assembly protein TadG
MKRHDLDNSNERGASLVEMAIVMPVLLMILIGIMELGVAFKDVLGASQAVREGVRMATFVGDSIDADCAVIEGMAPYLAASIDALDRVEIYQTTPSGNQIPGKTNIYTFTSGDVTECDDWTATVQWNSTARQVRIGSSALDIIGVRVIVEHDWISQFPPFSGSFDINETAIGRMEPESFE